jgi:hypothetical protein
MVVFSKSTCPITVGIPLASAIPISPFKGPLK